MRREALQALRHAPASDVLSCEGWARLRQNLCAALTEPDAELSVRRRSLSDNICDLSLIYSVVFFFFFLQVKRGKLEIKNVMFVIEQSPFCPVQPNSRRIKLYGILSFQDHVLRFFAKSFSSLPLNVTREIYSSLGRPLT